MSESSGQPAVCTTRPGRDWAGSTSHISLMPMPYDCGLRPSSSL
ncbi:Uncharacterised protein [Bordetella pertussis]|nr:Uncharacterised protein [Bordetella pertussis]CPO17185.1 Uncharacterised protein [Bordetella pertussis]